MYSIIKSILVLKLSFILILLMAGMGIISEEPNYTEGVNSSHILALQDYNELVTSGKQMVESEVISESCSNKSSLSDLRLYIEL